MPESYNNYFEPFVGGGVVLFGLQSATATVNDINGDLQEISSKSLKAIRVAPGGVFVY
jgi:site-specific DNA-adenine methylase